MLNFEYRSLAIVLAIKGEHLKRLLTACGIALAGLSLTACGSGGESKVATGEDAAKNVDVVSWWQAGSEAKWLEALREVFKKQHPETEFANKAISGGAGSQAKQKLQSDLAANKGLLQEDWEPAMKPIIDGAAAYNVMSDWAPAAFDAAKKEWGKDYVTFAVPGTADVFDFPADSFTLPVGAKHPTGTKNWLHTISSKEGQVAFNTIKGSIPGGVLIASVPTLLVYIVLGKYFIGRMTSGSVKG